VRVVLFVRVQHDVRENIFIIETWEERLQCFMAMWCADFFQEPKILFYFTMVFFAHVLLYFSISIGAISVDGTTL
jgi:hypothetical protein